MGELGLRELGFEVRGGVGSGGGGVRGFGVG